MALGYKIRTGGGLQDKVFGIFGTDHEDDEDDAKMTDESGAMAEAAELKQAKAWAKYQNVQSALNGRTFRFAAYVPETAEEAALLYAQFLARHTTPGAFALYK